MGFNKYILNIIGRSVLIALTALAMMFFAIKLEWVFTFIFLCLIFILQIYLMIRYVSKVNRDLANFLIHLKEQNTSLKLSTNQVDSIFGNLKSELNRINEEFKKIENEKIQSQNFLDTLLNRVGTGIMVIDSKNDIQLYNKALTKLLGIENNTNKELKVKYQSIIKDCGEINPGEQSIINLQVNNITRRILIALTEIKENKEYLKIYTFHDIDREMTDYELQSWNGLIKVLSHEIMNTLTPMSTTVDTLRDCLTVNGSEKQLSQLDKKDIQDAVKGINLLENRVNGLQDFIKRFRQFLDIPVPELKTTNLFKLISGISDSYKKKAEFNMNVEETLTVPVDNSLIELVLINIVKNSIEANANKIEISSKMANKQAIIEVKDNGGGIEPSVVKKAFLPFYTTKEGGSGIGLSLARQIMFAHNGNIEILSQKQGTCIRLYFKTEMNNG